MAPPTQNPEVKQSSPHFFTVINSAVIDLGRMSMPKNFVQKFFNEKPHLATLEVLDRRVWNVHLETTSNDVWFSKGLEAFISHYSICPGHFLIFRYEGNAHFHVIICDDMTGAEIDYPSKFVDLSIHADRNGQTRNGRDTFKNPLKNGRTLVIGLQARAIKVDDVNPSKKARTIILALRAQATKSQ